MKVAVWDTYVVKNDGSRMHFDIVVPVALKDAMQIYSFGKQYLAGKNEDGNKLSAEECSFCHIESVGEDIIKSIEAKGYHIIEMEGCE